MYFFPRRFSDEAILNAGVRQMLLIFFKEIFLTTLLKMKNKKKVKLTLNLKLVKTF